MDTNADSCTFLTIKQAAVYLQVSVHTIRRRIQDGSLRAYRVGKLLRIRTDTLEALAEPVARPKEVPARSPRAARAAARWTGKELGKFGLTPGT